MIRIYRSKCESIMFNLISKMKKTKHRKILLVEFFLILIISLIDFFLLYNDLNSRQSVYARICIFSCIINSYQNMICTRLAKSRVVVIMLRSCLIVSGRWTPWMTSPLFSCFAIKCF